MARTKRRDETIYSLRRKRVIKAIRGEAALFCSAPRRIISRDTEYPYRPDADLFYLTGIDEPDVALLLLGSSQGPRSVLFIRERDRAKEIWVGERLGLQRAKRRFDVDEVRAIDRLESELPKLLASAQVLHYAYGKNSERDALVSELLRTDVGPRTLLPHTLRDARLITAELRFVKDAHEIRAMRHAADITAHSIELASRDLQSYSSEAHFARAIETQFARFGSLHTAFTTIVAAGKNATTLHHTPGLHPLWRKELVLIDAGASYRGYAGDVSRTFPVSGKFTAAQADLYDVVAAARRAALQRARPDSTLAAIHRAAVREIAKGLSDLGILRGSPEDARRSESYKKYFMHRTSHWLGLDVHDVAPVRRSKSQRVIESSQFPLRPGNVFTVEPGIYIAPDDSSVKAPFRGIGIRIEDDVLITPKGHDVLSSRLPTERTEIESFLQ